MDVTMEENQARLNLDALIRARGGNYGALSRLIGRNAAYIQQYIKRGTPRKLDEADRKTLAQFFGVDESVLGAPALSGASVRAGPPTQARPGTKAAAPLAVIDRLDLGASAGRGTLDEDERPAGALGFDPAWLRRAGLSAESLSILRVDGESMAPVLRDGDDIMVDSSDGAARLRDGIYVLRFDDGLMVKRVGLSPMSAARAATAEPAARSRWSLTISSDNPHYPTWHDVMPDQVDIVGRVVWTGRRML
jgi:phage repressor protein C with HTH and peptisase S24 domain